MSSIEDAISEAGLQKDKEMLINSSVFDSLFGKDQKESEESLSFLQKELEVGSVNRKNKKAWDHPSKQEF